MVHIGNTFEQAIAKFYSESEFSLLQEAVIGIMGAGGLGSNCVVNLARSGIRHFIIADYDRVEMSNLNRQYYFPHHVGQFKVDALQDILTEINPNITVVTYREALTKDSIPVIYDAADILIEAFDSADAKSMFVEGTLSILSVARFIICSGDQCSFIFSSIYSTSLSLYLLFLWHFFLLSS